MQELHLVAVSEDGTYAVLAAPGAAGRFSLPVDDRLRVVARGQFSRLAQYDIEVESPLRPKEIQDRIRAGETAEEIADVAGVPIERVRRFEGPVLAERSYRAAEAQGATVRQPGDSGPGVRLGDLVAERLRAWGVDPEDANWDSRKRPDGDWQVQLTFSSGNRSWLAEWMFDPRRKHVAPSDDTAARLCLPNGSVPGKAPQDASPASATVTPIASRLGNSEHEPRRAPERSPAGTAPRPLSAAAAQESRPAAASQPPAPRERPARKAAGGRSRRSSVPSWDEIMFGTTRPTD